jgi:hypothetical protein
MKYMGFDRWLLLLVAPKEAQSKKKIARAANILVYIDDGS